MIWYSQIPGSKDIYAAFFNIGDDDKSVSLNFKDLGLKGKVTVRDLWKKQDVGQYKTSYQQKINKHGAALFRLSPKN